MSVTMRCFTAATSAVLAALLLAGCSGNGGSPSPSPSASRTTVSPSPTPTATDAAPSANLPTDCDDVGTAAAREEAVGDMTLQGDGAGFVRPSPEGATLALGCDWIVGDATGMLLLISTATPEAVTAAVSDLPAQGYSCQVSDDFGADFCDLPGQGPDTEEMIVARENVWIYLSTSNRNGRAFLSDIVQGVFG